MVYYRIVSWDEHYEVDKEGRSWTPGKAFRQGPLDYVRVAARRDWNIKTLELQDDVGEMVWFYVGTFEKLCQIVACEPRSRREHGIIRNSDGDPATREEIARMLRVRPATAAQFLQLLGRPDTHWVEAVGEEAAELENTAECAGHSEGQRQAAPLPQASREAASLAANRESRGKPLQNSPGHVMSEQNRTSQVRSKGLAPIAGFLGRLVPAVPHTEELDDAARGFLDSTRLGFLCEMRRTLRAEERVEARTVSNFEQWVYDNVSSGRAGPGLHQESLRIARDCVHGQKPVAVFLARAKRELGYVAPSRRTAAFEDVRV